MRTVLGRSFTVVTAILAFASPGSAQSKAPALAQAPVPGAMLSANKIFVSNGGGESFETVIDETVFNGGPDRPYNEFYADMKGWGRYEIVAAPADADLVFEVSWVLQDTGLRLPVPGLLRVEVIDPKTHVTLWSFIQYVRGAILLGNRDKNFDQAMNAILLRMKQLVVTPPPAAAQK